MLLACLPHWDLDNLSENINRSGLFHKSHSQGSPSAILGSCWKCCISVPEMSITGACSSAQRASAQPRNVPLTWPGCPRCIPCTGTKKSCLICCESLQPRMCLAWTPSFLLSELECVLAAGNRRRRVISGTEESNQSSFCSFSSNLQLA